jgi:hypothetical protein
MGTTARVEVFMFLSRRSIELIESKLLNKVVRFGADDKQIGKVVGVQFDADSVTPEGIIGTIGKGVPRLIVQLPDGFMYSVMGWTVVEARHAPETGNLIDDVLQGEIDVDGFSKLVGCDREQANRLIQAVQRPRETQG